MGPTFLIFILKNEFGLKYWPLLPKMDAGLCSLRDRSHNITHFIMDLLEEFNLIHQRLDLPLKLQASQRGIIHILIWKGNKCCLLP